MKDYKQIIFGVLIGLLAASAIIAAAANIGGLVNIPSEPDCFCRFAFCEYGSTDPTWGTHEFDWSKFQRDDESHGCDQKIIAAERATIKTLILMVVLTSGSYYLFGKKREEKFLNSVVISGLVFMVIATLALIAALR